MADVDIQKNIKALRDWISTQPHLPQNLEDRMLLRFLHSCYYNLENTQKCVELFFTLRGNSPEICTKRDPKSAEIQKFFKIVNLACLKISGNRNLWCWQLNDPGLEVYDYVTDAKVFFLSGDVWLLTDDHLEDSDIVIMDVKDITLKFLTKFNMSVAKKMGKYQEEGMPIRLKQIHAINAPTFIDKVHGLMKPFLKQEINDMIHFHRPNSDTIFKYINKEDLPDDFGGTAGKMAELMKKTLEDIMSQRDFFLNDKTWIADESKRIKSSKNKHETVKIVTPNFRTLAID